MANGDFSDFFRMVGFDPDAVEKGAQEAHDSGNVGKDAPKEGSHASGPTVGAEQIPFTNPFTARRGGKYKQGSDKAGGSGSGGTGGDGGNIIDDFVSNIKLPEWGKRTLIVAIIVLLVLIAGAYWWFHPPINIHSADLWSFLAIFVLLPSFITFRALSAAYKKGTGKRNPSAGRAKGYRWASFVPVVIAVLGVLGWAASFSIWPGNAERYSSILEVQELNFTEDIQEVDYNTIPVIDGASAVILGNRTLGEIPDYVSQFEISRLYSQINYQSRPVRVSPLNYADLFKWFYNKDTGIPAYVLVDMASQDTRVVRLDAPMYYAESEPLERNIDRYVQLKYPFYMFEQKAFEIDEDGTPWWVCPVQTRTIGLFGGEDIVRMVLVNACTGECQDLAIEDCPQWVDRAYPSDLVVQQYNWYGSLRNGWLNSWLGQSGVVQTTPGTDGLLGYNYIAKDDDVWVYTGVTSATADNAIVGFILVNQRTAEAHYYSVAGATEESAMRSAEGQVQQMSYNATFPLLLNINGVPTYFMALKDAAGLVKDFAMIDIQRYQNVAIGDTVAETQKNYKTLLVTNGAVTGDNTDDMLKATGYVRTATAVVLDGNTHVYITLADDDTIYDCPLPAAIEAVGAAPGDRVTLEYLPTEPTATVQTIELSMAKG